MFPLTRREDLRRQPWAFVPDSQRIGDLIVYTTSGTSGTRLLIPATPELPARYLPLIEYALRRQRVQLEGGRRVSIVQVCAQHGTVVLCSVSSYLHGAGFVKVNLDPSDWNNPDDPARFLDDCDPELYTGDPFALWQLARLSVGTQPKAIISAGTALSAGTRKMLVERFGCPVIDLYSMNETGPIAFSTTPGVHELFPHRLFVEVLDDSGRPCAPGARGQIVVTGGINPALPLVRYATGDYAAIRYGEENLPDLIAFSGRSPVVFRNPAGQLFSSIDVSTALVNISLPYIELHQKSDGAIVFRSSAEARLLDQAAMELRKLFGPQQQLTIECQRDDALSGKPIAYRSDLSVWPD